MGKLLDISHRLENSLVSKAIQEDPSELRRARLMLVIIGGSAISCFVLLCFSFLTSENEGWIDIVLLVGHIVVSLSIFIIKYVDSMKWPTRAVALLGALQLIVATSVSGGPDSIVLYALPVLPIFLAALVDIKTNLAASIIVLLGVCGIFFVDSAIAPFPEVSNSTWETLFALIWVMFMSVTVAAYSQYQADRLLVVAEEELERRKVAQVELAQVNESKDRFLAYMSHEMRNSLAAIVGASELLGMERLKSKHPRYIESLKNSANSLREIVETVLDFSQIDSGHMPFELEHLEVQPFLMDVSSQFLASAEKASLRLDCEISPGTPRYVVANKSKLRQVLSNLLSNAIKFSDPGDRVNLRASLDPSEGDGVLFIVEDSGIGIRHEDQAKIFVPYERSSEVLSRKGTGLGLPIAQVLLKNMGATLKLDSELNKGSRFYFVLPSASEQLVSYPSNKEIDLLTLSGRTVLVADDNTPASVVVLDMLRSMGCKVWHAKNGEEAIALYKEFYPDCVLMDIQMPIINGVEATLEIRKIEEASEIRPSRIIAVTGELDQDGFTESKGFNGLLQKPFRPPELAKVISWPN